MQADRPKDIDVRIAYYPATTGGIQYTRYSSAAVYFFHGIADLLQAEFNGAVYVRISESAEYPDRLYFYPGPKRKGAQKICVEVCKSNNEAEGSVQIGRNASMFEAWVGLYPLKFDGKAKRYYVSKEDRQLDVFRHGARSIYPNGSPSKRGPKVNKEFQKIIEEVSPMPEVKDVPTKEKSEAYAKMQAEIHEAVKQFALSKMIEAVRAKDIDAASLWLNEYEGTGGCKVLIND